MHRTLVPESRCLLVSCKRELSVSTELYNLNKIQKMLQKWKQPNNGIKIRTSYLLMNNYTFPYTGTYYEIISVGGKYLCREKKKETNPIEWTTEGLCQPDIMKTDFTFIS